MNGAVLSINNDETNVISGSCYTRENNMAWCNNQKKREGTASYDNNNLFGDLFITFDVEFPRGTLEPEEKEGMYSQYIKLHKFKFATALSRQAL
jgi:hypothetical protein